MTFVTDAQFEFSPTPSAVAEWPEPRAPEEVMRMLLEQEPPTEEYSVDAF